MGGVGQSSSPIIGGRVSGPDEDFAVFVETIRETNAALESWRCTGTFVAASIVVTARHCVIQDSPRPFGCTKDGELVNPAEGSILGALSSDVRVKVGSVATALRPVKVRKVFTTTAPSLCRDDLALLVLESPGDAPVAPIRITPARVAERVRVIGWGRTSEVSPPASMRQVLDDIPIEDVGPGLIPARSFATRGRTTCYGDSGGGAFVGGALVGVYSRIDTGTCELPTGRNVYTQISPFRVLIEQAFSEVGEPSPWANVPSSPEPPLPSTSEPTDAGSPQIEGQTPAPPPIRRGSAGACIYAPSRLPRSAMRETPMQISLIVVVLAFGLMRRRSGRREQPLPHQFFRRSSAARYDEVT